MDFAARGTLVMESVAISMLPDVAPAKTGAFKINGGPDITLPKLLYNLSLMCSLTMRFLTARIGGY